MAERRVFPIGEQDFANIRRDKMVYIDKTQHIYNIVRDRGKYFFFRPRRFGKSLLLSTMRYYFEGQHNLFEGLAIDSLEKEWRKRPVIYLDLSRGRTLDMASLHSMINNNLAEYETLYHVEPQETDSYSTRLTIYVVEFKINENAEAALQQIEDKQYAKPFENVGRTVYRIGINFSTKTKRIDDWKIK